jgi:hypothetical protein
MCFLANLHRYGTRLQLRCGFEDIFSAHASPQHDLPGPIEGREAAIVLAQVDPENSDLHGSILSSSGIGLTLRVEGLGIAEPWEFHADAGDAQDRGTVVADQPPREADQ